jgi:hypothetical protein
MQPYARKERIKLSNLWLTVISVLGGGLIGFITILWQSARVQKDALELARHSISNDAAQRLMPVLTDLGEALDDLDHLIFLWYGGNYGDPVTRNALLAQANRVMTIFGTVKRSYEVDGALLFDETLKGLLIELLAEIPLIACPVVSFEKQDTGWGGPDGMDAHRATYAVDSLRDVLAAEIRGRGLSARKEAAEKALLALK